MLWKGFQKPKRLEVERETATEHYGRFYAQPFERGFATTVGNSLRRVLLSSIEGAAVMSARISFTVWIGGGSRACSSCAACALLRMAASG